MAKKSYLKPKVEEKKTDGHDKLKSRLSVAKTFEKSQRKWWKAVHNVLSFKRDVTIGGDTQSQKIKYPLLWGAYDNYLSSLSTTPPQIVVEAEGREDNVKKIFWRGILEHAKRKMRADDMLEKFVQSFITTGKAVYKIGRLVETKKATKEAKVEGKGKIENEVEAVIKNESFVDVIDPRKVWISPETEYKGPILGDECPYIIEEMLKTPEYIKEQYDVTVDKEEKEKINMDEWLDSDDKSKVEHLPDEVEDDIQRVRVYAYYGLWEINGKLEKNAEVLFTTKRILKERKLPYLHGKKPYIYLLNFKNFFKATAHGSLDAVLDLDQEYNENMNRIRTYIRRMVNPKWAKTKGTTVDEAALLDPDIGTIVDESQPNAVRPLTPPSIDASIFEKAASVEQLFQLITGIVYGSSAIKEAGTATGQDIVAKGADVKISRMARLIERAQEERDIMLLQLEQQYASKDPTDIRIVGADVVKMIRDKKFLYNVQQQIYQRQIEQAIASGGVPQNETEPIDEYDKFQISADGKSVITNYTREDIQGEFELTVISQSSNRSNTEVQAQQIINALDKAANEPEIRKGLWRRLFALRRWDELVEAVETNPNMGQGAPGAQGQQPLNGAMNPNQANLNGAVNAQANQTV